MFNGQGLICWGLPGGTLAFVGMVKLIDMERLEWTLPE